MANPQKEQGFTPIAHAILEHLGNVELLGSEFRVILCVLRKTYGYGKKEDVISLTQFEKFTGLSRPTVVKTLKNLVTRNILVKSPLLAYKFNKDWDSWVVNPPLLVKSKHKFGKPALTKTSKPALTHNRKYITKDNTAGATPPAPSFRQDEYIKTLLESNQKHLKIIGLYFEQKGLVFPTKAAIQAEIKRNVRPATSLVGWDSHAIINTMNWLERQKLTWGLEAIVKNIARVNS